MFSLLFATGMVREYHISLRYSGSHTRYWRIGECCPEQNGESSGCGSSQWAAAWAGSAAPHGVDAAPGCSSWAFPGAGPAPGPFGTGDVTLQRGGILVEAVREECRVLGWQSLGDGSSGVQGGTGERGLGAAVSSWGLQPPQVG